MDTTSPRMTNLFLQLGLSAQDSDIANFIKTHQLPEAVKLTQASYWNNAQRQFLSEQLTQDAEWAIVVDELNEALHVDAEKRS